MVVLLFLDSLVSLMLVDFPLTRRLTICCICIACRKTCGLAIWRITSGLLSIWRI